MGVELKTTDKGHELFVNGKRVCGHARLNMSFHHLDENHDGHNRTLEILIDAEVNDPKIHPLNKKCKYCGNVIK